MAIVSSIVGAVISSALSGGGSVSSGQAQQMVDPFASYRGEYASQLNNLMSNPASVATLPGYQASLNQGTNNLNRELAATGRKQSGAEQVALSQYGQQFQRQVFEDQYNKLATLSGASASPAAGGISGINAGNQNQTNANQFAGAVAPSISNWLTSPSTVAPQNNANVTVPQQSTPSGNSWFNGSGGGSAPSY